MIIGFLTQAKLKKENSPSDLKKFFTSSFLFFMLYYLWNFVINVLVAFRSDLRKENEL